MGRDKASLPYRGRPLVESVAAAVRAAAGSAVLVGGPHADIPDLFEGEGPLGGILTALRHTQADWNVVAACDMPDLTADFLRQLLAEAELSDGDALVPAGPSGRLEPLCAAYHRRSLSGLQSAFDRGVRKITTALEQVRAIIWHVPEVSCFQNVNTPEEWAPYER